jgi:hypothetical protein
MCSAYGKDPAELKATLLRDKDLKVTAKGQELVYVCSGKKPPKYNNDTSNRRLLFDFSTAHLHSSEHHDHDHDHDHDHSQFLSSAGRRLQQVSSAGFDNGAWWPTGANYTATGVPILHRCAGAYIGASAASAASS